MSICTAIEKVTTHGDTDLLRVTIDNMVTALWFYDYADSLQFLNQEVIVDYRQDIYNGDMCQFIKTFTIPTVVTTLDKHEGFKLYLDQEDNQANTSFNEISSGETKYGCIVFCCKQENKSSRNASWTEYLIRDRFMRVAKLRMFNAEENDTDFSGQYVHCDLERNQYGFTTRAMVSVGGVMAINKEIAVAEDFVKGFFSADVPAMDYINKNNLLEAFKQHVDYEIGYGVVRLAMELAMADALRNVTKDVDVDAIAQALLCRYGYLTRSSILSPTVNNVFIAQQFMFPNRRCVVLCLDEMNEERPEEASVVKNIVDTVDNILRIRKGVE